MRPCLVHIPTIKGKAGETRLIDLDTGAEFEPPSEIHFALKDGKSELLIKNDGEGHGVMFLFSSEERGKPMPSPSINGSHRKYCDLRA